MIGAAPHQVLHFLVRMRARADDEPGVDRARAPHDRARLDPFGNRDQLRRRRLEPRLPQDAPLRRVPDDHPHPRGQPRSTSATARRTPSMERTLADDTYQNTTKTTQK